MLHGENEEAARIAHRQRLEQQAVDDGEDGRVRPDAEAERQDDGDREERGLQQRANAEPRVLPE
jgi:hypothetical protein